MMTFVENIIPKKDIQPDTIDINTDNYNLLQRLVIWIVLNNEQFATVPLRVHSGKTSPIGIPSE